MLSAWRTVPTPCPNGYRRNNSYPCLHVHKIFIYTPLRLLHLQYVQLLDNTVEWKTVFKMKRKVGVADEQPPENQDNQGKKKKLSGDVSPTMRDRFASNLFSSDSVKQYSKAYANSEPYKHAVVSGLVDDALLRSVRREILENIHFTPKETDIYKIHQSGDLANLDGLDPAALEKLPSLLQLRDALYSSDFRRWISEVSGAGPVSGLKTDMAVNVYVPGCHLLCHDDVIGSRRVSYILYLTDPDVRWQPSWGGALRLYSTDEKTGDDGKKYQVPREMWSKVIPPAWTQLSFFEVRPGESFHDVEEVYHRSKDVEAEVDGGRVRMAISGWFHIPQEGEEGYEVGLEERLAEQSSLQQLQGSKADQFDEPQICWLGDADRFPEEETTDEDGGGVEEGGLTAKDLGYLLQYMNPSLLTPDIVDELNDLFADESMIQLTSFLNPKFSVQLREHMVKLDANETQKHTRQFNSARPPHKHRYCYLQHTGDSVAEPTDPFDRLLHSFLPSTAFRKWLSLVSGLSVRRTAVMARRFRRGLDYQLAQGHESNEPQLEYTLNVTPSAGWGADEAEEHDREADAGERSAGRSQNDSLIGGNDGRAGMSEENDGVPSRGEHDAEEDNVGGYELYMASDDMDDSSTASSAVQVPASVQSHTGVGQRRSAKSNSHTDPAVYRSAEDEDDDGILFSNPASWNTFTLVLRDAGTLKFVKYVSARAQGDRWDFTGGVEVVDGELVEAQEE